MNTVQAININMDESYINAGFALVPIESGKGPKTAGWNKRERTITSRDKLQHGMGYGLAHAYSGTMALDVDEWASAMAILAESGIDLKKLTEARDAVMIDSGNPGHAKLLYRMPFGTTLASKKISFTASDKSKQVAFELRCATNNNQTVQDVLPGAALHPSTLRPYRWAGQGHYSQLPTIPTELLALWQELVAKDSERTISTDTIDASWDDIRAALYTIPADCSRDHWLTSLMALHHAGTQVNQLDQAEALAHEWSATGTLKYKGPNDVTTVWKSLKADNGIKTGSLFHIAMEYGYKQPTPDVSALFKSVVPVNPIEVLEDMRLPMPDMDMDLWPAILRTRSMEVAESVGCDPLVPLWAGLATICAAVDARTRLELMPGYEVPPVLWLMTIGDPADKKTPGARPMMGVLNHLENEDRVRFDRALLEWEAMDSVHQQSKKAYILAAGQNTGTILTGQLDNDTLPPVAPAPSVKPVDLRLVVNDVTSQKLVRLVADRPRGIMCHLDEMASWVNKLTDPRSGEDRSCWTKSYEADSYAMDRVGLDNTIFAKNMAVSIYGNIQPRVFRSKMRAMSDDGLLQRFIPAILRAHHTKRGEPIPDMFSCKESWDMKVREIYAMQPTTYRLDTQAYAIFRDFQLWYEQTKQDERLLKADQVYMQAFGKLEGTTGRLILLVHLVENGLQPMVTADVVQRVIKLIKGYVVPAYRYALGETGGLTEDGLERWCADRIITLSGVQHHLTLRELKRSAQRQVDDIPRHQVNQVMSDAMEPLERAGWVTVVNDHKDRKQWAINPDLGKANEAHRIAIIKAKQRRLDDSRAIVIASGKYTERRYVKGFDPDTME